MSTFKNEFSWSISRDRVFQTCPRQYYFNYYGYWGGWDINAPARIRQIYILKQLKNRYMWAGAKVHDCIERTLEKDIPDLVALENKYKIQVFPIPAAGPKACILFIFQKPAFSRSSGF